MIETRSPESCILASFREMQLLFSLSVYWTRDTPPRWQPAGRQDPPLMKFLRAQAVTTFRDTSHADGQRQLDRGRRGTGRGEAELLALSLPRRNGPTTALPGSGPEYAILPQGRVSAQLREVISR